MNNAEEHIRNVIDNEIFLGVRDAVGIERFDAREKVQSGISDAIYLSIWDAQRIINRDIFALMSVGATRSKFLSSRDEARDMNKPPMTRVQHNIERTIEEMRPEEISVTFELWQKIREAIELPVRLPPHRMRWLLWRQL